MVIYPALRLKKHEEKRLQKGHIWIYSNEVDIAHSPFKNFQPGQLAQVERSDGKVLGLAYVNPHTLLCARLLVSGNAPVFGPKVIEQRIKQALDLRQALFPQPYYRLIYGESDALPGLIVDRYGEVLVLQLTTAGMEALKGPVLAALQHIIQPTAILLRNDHGMRELEGLTKYVEAGFGTVPERLELIENGVRFCIQPWQGQKTGWFYDHRDSRAQLARFVKGKRVLDLFSYVGGWSVQAAVFGATEVYAVDSSAAALAMLEHNAQINQVADRVHCWEDDVFKRLKLLLDSMVTFDMVILDPPAFIKKRKDAQAGLTAYYRINEMALRLLAANGILISCSCSSHLSREDLLELVSQAGLKAGRRTQLIAQGHQGPDHPIHPAIPETEYLKALFFRVI